jgi:hypothetical protein
MEKKVVGLQAVNSKSGYLRSLIALRVAMWRREA